jgi:hypothetical protein
MALIPSFSEQQLEAIAKLLSDVVTGSEITRVLQQAEIYKDIAVDDTKWKRLRAAFVLQQRSDGHGSRVAKAIEIVMDPIRFTQAPQQFSVQREHLNRVLAFCGMELGEDGRLRKAAPVQTLTEAQQRARSLYQRLVVRGAHRDVLRYCAAELLEDNYFHAVLERPRACSSGCGNALVSRPMGMSSLTRHWAAARSELPSAACVPRASGASKQDL